jgi:hypothetical protein
MTPYQASLWNNTLDDIREVLGVSVARWDDRMATRIVQPLIHLTGLWRVV